MTTVKKRRLALVIATSLGLLAIPAATGAEAEVTVAADTGAIEIYEDQTEFQNWSWAATDLASTGQVHEGSSAIAVDYGAWHGLYLASLQPIDLPADGTLQFWVHGGTGPNLPIRVAMVDENRNPTRTITIRPLRNRWTLIERSVSDFGQLDQLTGIWWMNASNSARPTVYFDDIAITSPNPPPPPPPHLHLRHLLL